LDYAVFTDLRGDAGRLRQVLTNVLNNAIKFTKHGEVILRISQRSETATEVVLRFEVKDTGIGIDSEAQEHLFEAFSQENSSTTRKYGGTGLGLAIARQLVRMMHGEIGVESELEKGAVFWFTAHFEKQARARRTKESKEGLVGIHALIVNDNCSNYVLRLHLANLGMRFSAVSGCSEALELLRSKAADGEPFRLAILDLMTPEIDGLEFARSIKEDPSLVSTRLVLLTAVGQRMDMDVFKAVGLGESLVKPVKQSRLRDCLTAVVTGGATNLGLSQHPPVALTDRQASSDEVRILLAEDNLINQKVAIHQLEKYGYRADVASDGSEVLRALAGKNYDVILMDCQMPEMNGYETTQTIREREKHGVGILPVYIVAMTASAMHGEREKCLALGMDDYLSKPVQAPELHAALARWKQAVKIRAIQQPLLATGS
jgi:two-component system, sensor histidine kinase and response regulator